MSEQSLRRGDRVQWNASQGTTRGTVMRKVTRPTAVDGTELKGASEDPVYIVESEKTGRKAGHKAGALRKIS